MIPRAKQIGRRGLCLALVALLIIGIGWSTISAPPKTYAALPLISSVHPLYWGILQIIIGFVALFFVTKPSGKDSFGFQLALLVPTIWGLDNFASGLLGQYPSGSGVAFRQGALWFGYAILILILSGMIGVEELGQKKAEPPHDDDEEG